MSNCNGLSILRRIDVPICSRLRTMQTISEPESEKIAVFRGVKNRQLTGSDVPEQGRTRDISLGWQEPDPEAIYN